MSHNDHNHQRQDHITAALDALGAYRSHDPETYSDGELLLTLSDLAEISKLVATLADQSRQELSTWATVAPHLVQAQEHARALARSLNHACGTLAFNSALQPAA